MGNVTVLVGAQWGDESKGKHIDRLGQEADVVARYAGGNNAGHTVDDGETVWKFHLLPSAILNPDCLSILGDGVVIDPAVLYNEIKNLKSDGRTVNLRISERSHVIMPYHRKLDGLREKRLAGKKIGTTGRGIGPAYCHKAERIGIRMGEFVASPDFKTMLCDRIRDANQLLRYLYDEAPIKIGAIIEEYAEYAAALQRYVGPIYEPIYQAVRDPSKRVVFEGAQGAWLDPDYGTYPYVTSSHPVAGGACLGTGIGPRDIDEVIAVAKAYTTRVGEGPLPSEMPEDLAEKVRAKGKEYGTTTGRGRRVGWFDAMPVKLSCRFNSASSVILSHLDVLCGEPEVKIGIGWEIDGEPIAEMPARTDLYPLVKPVYETLPGWDQPVIDCRSWSELPKSCQAYIKRIEELIECPITVISVGPQRDQTIVLD